MASRRTILILLLPVFWWGMMAIHELGHILSTKLNGGVIDSVELRPWMLSQTERHGSAHELMDIWAGPLFGSLAPVLIWLMGRKLNERPRYYAAAWAGICLIINGMYLALGWLTGEANDSGEIVEAGTSPILIVLVGAALAGSGLYGIHVLLERDRTNST